MAISRIARIHLVYQFIILTLLVIAIGYNEVLPDKKFLFLALIPVFCYQIIIVFCCTEILPLPQWFRTEESTVTTDRNSETTEDIDSSSPGLSSKKTEVPEAVPSSVIGAQIDISEVPIQTNFAKARRSESTKSYYFPYREKRLQDSLNVKEYSRPYKIRSWRSLYDQTNRKNLTQPANEVKEATPSPVQLDTLDETSELNGNNCSNEVQNWRFLKEKKSVESQVSFPLEEVDERTPELQSLEESVEVDSNDLTKSYSFPFRQRKQGRWMESKDKMAEDYNIPTMPAWNAIDYFSPSNCYGRRKSVSTEAIDRELRQMNSIDLKGKNDFTQSMEMAPESVVPEVTKRGLKSSHSFHKLKQGFANLIKLKKENNKADDAKANGENKKQYFKEFFSSKDDLGKEVSSKGNFFRFENRLGSSNKSPSYISYETDEDDEKFNVYHKGFE